MSKKDEAWEAIFSDLDIRNELHNNGYASISAEKIKEVTRNNDVGQQEPRIITKFDAREHRAKILQDHDCTILATSNGQYSILKGDGYHDAEDISDIQRFNAKIIENLKTLPSIYTSESQVIDAAKASGLLENFLEEEYLELTIRGRLRSGIFDFNFDSYGVNVNGVQIEVDAGYEGSRIYLLEAKMGTRDNFITRQLYYPYRMWDIRIAGKEIVPIFISYSDKTFYIYQYAFSDKNQYNSIELVKSGAFVLEDLSAVTTTSELKKYKEIEYLKNVSPLPNEHNVPFPQADDVRKIIDTIFAVANGFQTTKTIASYYEFDERQSGYYGNAAKYLGLLESENGLFKLSEKGDRYISSTKEDRRLMMVREMMNSPTVNALYKETINTGEIPDLIHIAQTILNHREELNRTTASRRARTMKKWLEWLMMNTS